MDDTTFPNSPDLSDLFYFGNNMDEDGMDSPLIMQGIHCKYFEPENLQNNLNIINSSNKLMSLHLNI